MLNSRRKIVEVGLASGLLLTAGCDTTMGNTFAAPDGQCLTMKGDLTLSPQQELYVGGGDISFNNNGHKSDFLLIKNLGNDVLQLTRSAGDGGTLEFGQSAAQIAPNKQNNSDNNSNTNIHLTISATPNAANDHFVYAEDKATTSFQVSQAAGHDALLAFDTTCQSK